VGQLQDCGPLTELALKAPWIPARPAAVRFNRILHAGGEPQNWLTYSGTKLGQRYSALAQVTPENVSRLELAWVWQAQSEEKFEATPLVVDGILFTVEPPNTVVALDAATGGVLWKRTHIPPPETQTCCGGENRGVAILGDRLFLGTLDAHLLAIEARTGNLICDTTVAQALDPFCKGSCYAAHLIGGLYTF
jgi:alcohol dehydrogenase (cytochrome c)